MEPTDAQAPQEERKKTGLTGRYMANRTIPDWVKGIIAVLLIAACSALVGYGFLQSTVADNEKRVYENKRSIDSNETAIKHISNDVAAVSQSVKDMKAAVKEQRAEQREDLREFKRDIIRAIRRRR